MNGNAIIFILEKLKIGIATRLNDRLKISEAIERLTCGMM